MIHAAKARQRPRKKYAPMMPNLRARYFCLSGRWFAMAAIANALSTLSNPSIIIREMITGRASINAADVGSGRVDKKS